MRIGIDIMGGDNAPLVTIEGAILARQELAPEITLVLIGDSAIINETLKSKGVELANTEIIHTSEIIGMCEQPTRAIGQKPDSSIAIGFKMLQEGSLDGFASAGNSGAMVVGAMYTVKSIPGILRPCIATLFPKEDGSLGLLLDVGANVDCKPEVLYQFGVLGSIYLKQVHGVDNPRVGLLSVGEEKGKGNIVSQAAYELYENSDKLNFIGNLEGRDILVDKADVFVCDGQTGNIILKLLESVYYLLKKRDINDSFIDGFNYENYGGTPILGVNSSVIIGHGMSNKLAIKNMILQTTHVVSSKVSDKIKEAFQ